MSEVIARIFVHSETKTTIRYLGLDFEDMLSAFELYSKYQKAVAPDLPKAVKTEVELDRVGGALIRPTNLLARGRFVPTLVHSPCWRV